MALRCASSITRWRSWPNSWTASSHCRTAVRSRRGFRRRSSPIRTSSRPISGGIMLQLEGVTAHYGKNEVVSNADIALNPGEVVALIGANAAGKSTTMRLIVGLKKATAGVIRFDGQDITAFGTPRRVRLGITLVPEGRQVFALSSVHENLVMGAYHRPDRDRIAPDIEAVCAMFPRLAERRRQ